MDARPGSTTCRPISRRRRLHRRRGRGEQIVLAAGERGIDALAVDGLLGRLGGCARGPHLAIPAFRVERAPIAEIEHGECTVTVVLIPRVDLARGPKNRPPLKAQSTYRRKKPQFLWNAASWQ